MQRDERKINARAIERKIVNVKPSNSFRLNNHAYVVDEVYSHHAKCLRDDGAIECFTVGDFVLMGVESPAPTVENCIGL